MIPPKKKIYNTFTSFSLKSEIMKAIDELGFVTPTPIQKKVIPHLLSSKQDLIASAQTGTGKTAAFALPLLQSIDFNNNNIQMLVLCPTRELCIQISKDLINYSKYLQKINIVPIYGGARIENQMRGLKKKPQIVIGTPGRTTDLIRRKKLILNKINYLILDEADEMMSMGFKDDLESIIDSSNKTKQTLLFSATMTKKVESVTKKYMKQSLDISVGVKNKGADNIEHILYVVHAKHRYEVVKRIADINPDIYGIVFCRTRAETKDVANKLIQDNYNADTIHGDLSQAQRDDVMLRFRKKQIQLLIATDVAARGLDVNDLTHVINYNLPDDNEIYVHRSGRTGRAGKKGISIVIIHGRELRKIRNIENASKISFKKKQVPTGLDICKKRLYKLIEDVEKVDVNEKQILQFLPFVFDKLNFLDREQLIKHFISIEFNRYLSYYKNSQDINLSTRIIDDDNKGRSRGKGKGRNKNKNKNRNRDRRKKFSNSKNKNKRFKRR